MMPAFQRCISATDSFRAIFAVVGFALGLLTPIHVEAQQQRTYDPRDVYMLPTYCKYTQNFRAGVPGGNNPAEIERLTNSMGPVFIHMHHYCWGLMASNRAAFFSNTQQERTHKLYESVSEFDYVIQRAPKDFELLPEILTKKGESLIRLNRGGEGMLDLLQATQLKAGYWPAYAAISDYLKETGEVAKAREWLEKGLSVAPNAKALKQRLAELDAAKGKRKKNQ